MLFDLLTPLPSSRRRARRLRRTVALCATAYLVVTAAPNLTLVVHDHDGGDHAHSHAGAAHGHDHAAVHHHYHDHHHHDHDHHHRGHHGDHAPAGQAEHRHGAAPVDGDAPLLGAAAPRPHWHSELRHNLATAGLPLLVAAVAAVRADVVPAAAAPRNNPQHPTRVRGPPRAGSALSNNEI